MSVPFVRFAWTEVRAAERGVPCVVVWVCPSTICRAVQVSMPSGTARRGVKLEEREIDPLVRFPGVGVSYLWLSVCVSNSGVRNKWTAGATGNGTIDKHTYNMGE